MIPQALLETGASAGTIWRIVENQEQAAPYSDHEEQIITILQGFYLHGSDCIQADTARKIIKESGFTKPHDIHHLFVKGTIWKPNVNIPLLRQNLPTSFSTKAISGWLLSGLKKRLTLIGPNLRAKARWSSGVMV